MTIRKDLEGLQPQMRTAFEACQQAWAQAGLQVRIVETVRTLQRQRELVAAGASKTYKSKHRDGLAVDVCFDAKAHGLKGPWDTSTPQAVALWLKLGAIGEAHGMRWGGRFAKGGDLPPDSKVLGWDAGHFELRSAGA